MNRTLLLTALIVCILCPLTASGQWTGDAKLFFGAKMLDKDDWEPVEEHAELGLMFDFGQEQWPFNIAIDVLGSVADDTENIYGYYYDYEVETSELNLGIRKAWGDVLRPYLGGGIAFITAKYETSALGVKISEDDNGVGYWINGGLMLTLANTFDLGLDLRYSDADVTLLGYDVEAGGTHAGIFLGLHW